MDVLGIITKELKAQHKTQKSLTDCLGVTKNVFTDWKLEKSRSYERYLPQIADFLGVTVDYLLGRTDIKKAPAKGEGEESSLDAELLQAIAGHSDEVKRKVIALLKELQPGAEHLP